MKPFKTPRQTTRTFSLFLSLFVVSFSFLVFGAEVPIDTQIVAELEKIVKKPARMIVNEDGVRMVQFLSLANLRNAFLSEDQKARVDAAKRTIKQKLESEIRLQITRLSQNIFVEADGDYQFFCKKLGSGYDIISVKFGAKVNLENGYGFNLAEAGEYNALYQEDLDRLYCQTLSGDQNLCREFKDVKEAFYKRTSENTMNPVGSSDQGQLSTCPAGFEVLPQE